MPYDITLFLEGNGNAFKEIAGHLQKMLKTLDKEQCGKWLNLVFAAQVFDAAGAQGQRFMYGSRTFTDDFYRAYNLMHEMMHQLFNQSPDLVLQAYVSQRAAWMDLDQDSFIEKEAFDVIVRLGCTVRLFGSEADKMSAQILKNDFYQLSADDQRLLTEELSFNRGTGLNLFGHAPHYVATGGQNACHNEPGTILRPQDSRNAWHYTIVLARVIKKLRMEHHLVVQDSVLPINFGGVAALASGGDLSVLDDPHAVDLDRLLASEPILPASTVANVVRKKETAAHLIGLTVFKYIEQKRSGGQLIVENREQNNTGPILG